METTLLETVGERIARLRLYRGLTQTELARRAGVSRSYISRLEAGDYQDPGGPQIAALGRVLDVSADYVLNGADCGEELPPDLQAMYRLLSPEERLVIDELVAQRHKLPNTPEGRQAFREGIRVAILYIRGKLAHLDEP